MNPTQYRVVRGSIQLPRAKQGPLTRFVEQGCLLPDGVFDDADIQSWLDEGRIEVATGAQAQVAKPEGNPRRSKWNVDPETLIGKSMEDLLIMVNEIDSEFDVDQLQDEQDAIRLLCSGWEPRYAETIPPASDRSEPAPVNLSNLNGQSTSSSNRPMAQSSKDALAAARAKAAAPKE